MAVADHLLSALAVAVSSTLLEPIIDFGLDGLGQHLLGAIAEEFGEDVVAAGQWHNPGIAGRTLHGGVLLWPRWPAGKNLARFLTQGTPPFFIRLSTTFGHSSAQEDLRCWSVVDSVD